MNPFAIRRLHLAIATGALAVVCAATTLILLIGQKDWQTTLRLSQPILGYAVSTEDLVIQLSTIDSLCWWSIYFAGIPWLIYLLESAARRIENRRALSLLGRDFDPGATGVAINGEAAPLQAGWNPFDPDAVYYRPAGFWLPASIWGAAVVAGWCALWPDYPFLYFFETPREGEILWNPTVFATATTIAGYTFAASVFLGFLFIVQARLRQSLMMLALYSGLVLLLWFLSHPRVIEEKEGYDLPAGGGKDSIQASSVKVVKVIKKKYVINPYSSIIFSAPPPIDQVDVKLSEETQNRYQVGQGGAGDTGDGDGEGAGFGKGAGKGKVSFVRLKHDDRGWDRNFGIGGDRNMLSEYNARTKQKVAEETEYITMDQLGRFPAQKCPPLLYISGSAALPLSAADKKILKQYLTERHGMILGDNQGGQGFHQAFVSAMNEITGSTPVAIARDDRIHQRPYALPQLPIVVAHGPPVPLGWKVDGRWAVYYHPGALSDAWRDDHAGIKKEVYESCYQLGVNIIFYSLQEKNKWLASQKP